MKKKSTPNHRNLGVIVLAGTVGLLTTMVTLSLLPLTWENAGLVLTGGLVALIALVVAISGRVNVFKHFVEAIGKALT